MSFPDFSMRRIGLTAAAAVAAKANVWLCERVVEGGVAEVGGIVTGRAFVVLVGRPFVEFLGAIRIVGIADREWMSRQSVRPQVDNAAERGVPVLVNGILEAGVPLAPHTIAAEVDERHGPLG